MLFKIKHYILIAFIKKKKKLVLVLEGKNHT